ncbi:MAG: flagellar hook-associated protein FlgK [FCB group bacterium]|nr:flagellar hook-associated protein FlgK [FCB group bacterium]
MSLFQGLEIGKRALLTHQLSMSTIGHNMANVSTPGYSRQRVNATSTRPHETANYNIGSGVTISGVTSVRDFFLTAQYRSENKSLGEWASREKALGQIETFFNEPNDEGLGNVLNEFWSSWSDLSANPESMAARSAVIAKSNSLVTSFHSLDRQLLNLQTSTDQDVVNAVGQINLYAQEIANLNRIVVGEELGAATANDSRDQRDLLLDELSSLVDVTTIDQSDGSVSVFISGLALVEKADTFNLGTKLNTSGRQAKHDIVWQGTTTNVKITGGQLKGLVTTRDEVVTQFQTQLDEMASALIENVNTLHRAGSGLDGSGGLNFFNSRFDSAGTLQLETALVNDASLIAASASGAPGDNAVALDIADLSKATVMSYGTATMSEYYNSMIGTIGVNSYEAKMFKGNYEVLVEQIENSRQSVQGVNLDEEMAEMVQAQHAYNAAARVITMMDEALEVLINGTGVVGR